jgi:hypothetical protein
MLMLWSAGAVLALYGIFHNLGNWMVAVRFLALFAICFYKIRFSYLKKSS